MPFGIHGHLMPGSHDEVRERMDAYLARAEPSETDGMMAALRGAARSLRVNGTLRARKRGKLAWVPAAPGGYVLSYGTPTLRTYVR